LPDRISIFVCSPTADRWIPRTFSMRILPFLPPRVTPVGSLSWSYAWFRCPDRNPVSHGYTYSVLSFSSPGKVHHLESVRCFLDRVTGREYGGPWFFDVQFVLWLSPSSWVATSPLLHTYLSPSVYTRGVHRCVTRGTMFPSPVPAYLCVRCLSSHSPAKSTTPHCRSVLPCPVICFFVLRIPAGRLSF